MPKSMAEEVLYWLVSAIINLTLFTFLAGVFIVSVQETPELYPIKVQIREIPKPKPKKRIKSVVKVKSEAKKTVSKRVKAAAKKRKLGSTVTSAPKKGDVKVPVQKEEDISLLAELQKRIEARLRKEEEGKRTRRVGNISAVVTGKQVRIRGGDRRIVYSPPIPELITKEFPASVKVRIWVSSDGRVVKAFLLQRSGNARIDSILISYVKAIRFEKIKEKEIQIGEITFRFRGG